METTISKSTVLGLIQKNKIWELKKIRQEMTSLIPKELLNEENYETVEMIDQFLNQSN